MENSARITAEIHIPKGSWLEIIHLINSFIWLIFFQLIGIAFFLSFWIREEQSETIASLVALIIISLFNIGVILRIVLFLITFPKIFMKKINGYSRDELEDYENERSYFGIRYKYSTYGWYQLIFSTILTLVGALIVYVIITEMSEKFLKIPDDNNLLSTSLSIILIVWITSTLMIKMTLLWRGLRTLRRQD